MIKDFYICLDNTALNYALKHFSNPFTRIMRCYNRPCESQTISQLKFAISFARNPAL